MSTLPWPPPPSVRRTVCDTCSGNIFWQDCPTGGWWIHHQHPEDGHDALPNLDVPLATLTSAVVTPVDEPEYKAVIVIEVDSDHLPEAIGDLQRFLSAHRLNESRRDDSNDPCTICSHARTRHDGRDESCADCTAEVHHRQHRFAAPAMPEEQMLYGPTLHVAIEDVAEAVLQHFASAPLIDEDILSPYLERPHAAGCSLDDNHRGMCLRGTRVGN